MKRNKSKLLILAFVIAISISSFGLSKKNMTKTTQKPHLGLDILFGINKGKEEGLQRAFRNL